MLETKMQTKAKFEKDFRSYIDQFEKSVSTDEGEWIVKGFIDVAKNVYTISLDTKVISKILELLLIPEFVRFSKDFGYKLVLTKEQNFYPDITLISDQGEKIAIDIKTTYRVNDLIVNGMTLGAFTGYFRDRTSKKNIMFPYNEYVAHYVFGAIYTRVLFEEEDNMELKKYSIDNLKEIASVIKDFKFFLQEKYKIATSQPGSGNTKNIGSVKSIKQILSGTGPFAELGVDTFDDYWMYFLTADMARKVDLKVSPYRNLKEYLDYKNK